MSRQSVFKHKVNALYIVKAMFFNNKSINTQLIPMPIWVAQLSLVGHKEKEKQYMKMDGTSVIEGGDWWGQVRH